MLISTMIALCLISFSIKAEPIEQMKLSNGLTVLIKPDHRAPIAIVMIWYHVGSAEEPGGLTGTSHALEHMMFKGTPSVAAGKFSQIIAQQGGQDNAFTNNDYTAYFEKISTNALKTALSLEADRMQNLLLSANDFAKEIKVVQEERRLRTDNNPQAVAIERFLATAHLIPPYQHPVIGWMSDLQHLTAQDLRTWYERFYAPNNATLVIVGDVTPKTLLPWIQQLFGSIKKQAQLKPSPQAEPPSLGEKVVTLHIPAQQPLLILGYTVPSLKNPSTTQDAYALELLSGVLDAGNNARLTNLLIQKNHIAVSAGAYYNLYTRYPSQFMLIATPAPTHSLEDLSQALLTQIKALQTTLVPNEELARIKTQLIAQKTFQKDSLFGQAMEIGLLASIGLPYQTSEAYVSKIQAITPEQLRETARHYFQKNNLTTAQLRPTPPSQASS
jgi:zinc protease